MYFFAFWFPFHSQANRHWIYTRTTILATSKLAGNIVKNYIRSTRTRITKNCCSRHGAERSEMSEMKIEIVRKEVDKNSEDWFYAKTGIISSAYYLVWKEFVDSQVHNAEYNYKTNL